MLQHAIGGVVLEIRVCMQYLIQAWGVTWPNKIQDAAGYGYRGELAHR
jgi:Mn-containing catalase